MTKREKQEPDYFHSIDLSNIKYIGGGSFKESILKFLPRSKADWNKFVKSAERFQKARLKFHEVFSDYLAVVYNELFINVFFLWAHLNLNDELFSFHIKNLLEKQVIKFLDDKRKYLRVQDLTIEYIVSNIDLIRSLKEFKYRYRDSLVKTYLEVVRWAYTVSYKSTVDIQDPERVKTKKRALSYEMFCNLVDNMEPKYQIVAELLYLGGSRTMDQVVNVKIGDINFNKNSIKFGTHVIHYPKHVITEIKEIVGTRKSGNVFIGRMKAPLAPATIFRNFNEAASQIGLGEGFSPKSLTTDV